MRVELISKEALRLPGRDTFIELLAPTAPAPSPTKPASPPRREPDTKPVVAPPLPEHPNPGERPGPAQPIAPSCPIEPRKRPG